MCAVSCYHSVRPCWWRRCCLWAASVMACIVAMVFDDLDGYPVLPTKCIDAANLRGAYLPYESVYPKPHVRIAGIEEHPPLIFLSHSSSPPGIREGSPSTSLSRTSRWFGTSTSFPVWFPAGRISLLGRWWPQSAFPRLQTMSSILTAWSSLRRYSCWCCSLPLAWRCSFLPFCIQGRWLPWDPTNTWHTSSLCTSSGWEDSMPFFIKNQVGESSNLTYHLNLWWFGYLDKHQYWGNN